MRTDRLPEPLSRQQEEGLLFLMRKKGSRAAREKLIIHNLRLVYAIAWEYAGILELEDLVSCGVIGLIKAVDAYDGSRKAGLGSFAARCIRNEIISELRRMKRNERETLEAITPEQEMTLWSLHRHELDPQSMIERSEEREALYKALKHLGREDRQLLKKRYLSAQKCSQQKLAEQTGLHQSSIARREMRILETLRRQLPS